MSLVHKIQEFHGHFKARIGARNGKRVVERVSRRRNISTILRVCLDAHLNENGPVKHEAGVQKSDNDGL